MTIFKNGIPFRGVLERRKHDCDFFKWNSYASIGKRHLSKDTPSETKGKVFSFFNMLQLSNVSRPILPKFHSRSSRISVIHNRIMKKERFKLMSDPSVVINCGVSYHTNSSCPSKLASMNVDFTSSTGSRNNQLKGNNSPRFYSHLSMDGMTFGELLCTQKNVDLFEKDYSVVNNIPTYMLINSKFPTLAVFTEINNDCDHTENQCFSYYSFDSKNISTNANSSSSGLIKENTNDYINRVSLDKIPKKPLSLATLYEQYFSSKVYSVKINKIENETEVKIRKITRQLYPLNRKQILQITDPILKYLNIFRSGNDECAGMTAGEKLDSEQKLYLTAEDEGRIIQKQGIREKPVPRNQLPPDISNQHSQSILNIINSIDRSETVIHKDLYITNKVIEQLKEIEKKKESPSQTNEKVKFETNDAKLFSTSDPTKKKDIFYNESGKEPNQFDSSKKNLTLSSHDKGELTITNKSGLLGTETGKESKPNDTSKSYESIYALENLSHNQKNNKSVLTNSKGDITIKTELDDKIGNEPNRIDSSKNYAPDGFSPIEKLSTYNKKECIVPSNYTNDSLKNKYEIITGEKSSIAFHCKNENSYKIYPVEKLSSNSIELESKSLSTFANQDLTNKNELIDTITGIEPNKNYKSFNINALAKSQGNVENTLIPVKKEKFDVKEKDHAEISTVPNGSKLVNMIVPDNKISNYGETVSNTSISQFTYPPTFVDNIVTNLRNPTPPRAPKATTSQSRSTHSKSGSEINCTVDVLTETSITSTRFGEKAKIQIHEVQTFKDKRVPLRFTTDTLMEMQGSSDKLRAATEVVEVAKAKLVLSKTNADIGVKSSVENAIKLAELLSFLKNKVMVGNGNERKRIPIQIVHQKEIKSDQSTNKTPPNRPTINMTETKLSDKTKRQNVIKGTVKSFDPKESTKRISAANEKQPATKPSTITGQLFIRKVDTDKQKNDAVEKKVLKKEKKPEDEIEVVKVNSRDLKKILGTSTKDEPSIHLINNKVEKMPKEELLKKKPHKEKARKQVLEKKNTNPRFVSKKRKPKKIFEIKPLIKDVSKNEGTERKSSVKPFNDLTGGKKLSNELTDRDLKIIDNIKKGNEDATNTTTNSASISTKVDQKKLGNVRGEKQDLSKSNKSVLSSSNAKLSSSSVTYDVIKIPGDEGTRAKFEKPQKKKKETIKISGENESSSTKTGSGEKKVTVTDSIELVSVKEINKNDKQISEVYKNILIKKKHITPDVTRKSIVDGIQPKQFETGRTKEENDPIKTFISQQNTEVSKSSQEISLQSSKKPDVDKLANENVSGTQQRAMTLNKELGKYLKPKGTQEIKKEINQVKAPEKQVAEKVGKSPEISAQVPKKPDVGKLANQNVSGTQQRAMALNKELGPRAEKPKGSQEIKKEIKQVKAPEKQVAKKVSKSPEISGQVPKKSDVIARDSKSIGDIKKSAQNLKKEEIRKDKAVEKHSSKTMDVSSKWRPHTSKKPDVKVVHSKNKQVKKVIQKDLIPKPDVNKKVKDLNEKQPTSTKRAQAIKKVPDAKPKGPEVSKFLTKTEPVKSEVLKKPEIGEKKPIKIADKGKVPTHSSPVIPSVLTLPSKTNQLPLPADLNIDLDKLSKETKHSLDIRSAQRSLVSLDKLLNFPLLNPHKSLYERPKDGIICVDCKKDPVLRQKLKTLPSVTKVLNATMSDSSRIALAKWRSKMISDLGEDGFQEFYKAQIESGTNFHDSVENHFKGNIQDLVNSPNPALRSISIIAENISDVSIVESHVIHQRLAYRGIIDCVAKYNNKPVLIEWKRSDKKKKLLQSTYDAPIQLCAYIGALNFDSNYKTQVEGGVVIVAYSDGTPADVFTIPLDECQKYWRQWLGRLRKYTIDAYGKP